MKLSATEVKLKDTTENHKSIMEINIHNCIIPRCTMQYPQIPPYILKHYISIINKQKTSFISSLTQSLLAHCCNLQQLPSIVSKIPQQYLHVPQPKVTLQADNTSIDDGQYIYQMKSKPLGLSIILNNENFKMILKSRLGTAIDTHSLCNLFSYFGFDNQRHDNKTHTEMRQILNNVADLDHDKYDCLIVAILTHGDYGDVLYGNHRRNYNTRSH